MCWYKTNPLSPSNGSLTINYRCLLRLRPSWPVEEASVEPKAMWGAKVQA